MLLRVLIQRLTRIIQLISPTIIFDNLSSHCHTNEM